MMCCTEQNGEQHMREDEYKITVYAQGKKIADDVVLLDIEDVQAYAEGFKRACWLMKDDKLRLEDYKVWIND